jgi:hypothetical protein
MLVFTVNHLSFNDERICFKSADEVLERRPDFFVGRLKLEWQNFFFGVFFGGLDRFQDLRPSLICQASFHLQSFSFPSQALDSAL